MHDLLDEYRLYSKKDVVETLQNCTVTPEVLDFASELLGVSADTIMEVLGKEETIIKEKKLW